MNKIVGLMICTLLAATVSYGAKGGEGNIAVVNMSKLVQAYPETAESEAVLKKRVDEFEEEKDALMKKMEGMKEELETIAKESQNVALSDAAVAEKKKQLERGLLALREFQSAIKSKMRDRQKEIGKEKLELQKRIFDKLSEIVEKYAVDKGYDVVIDVSSLIYHKDGLDITPAVIKIIEKGAK